MLICRHSWGGSAPGLMFHVGCLMWRLGQVSLSEGGARTAVMHLAVLSLLHS